MNVWVTTAVFWDDTNLRFVGVGDTASAATASLKAQLRGLSPVYDLPAKEADEWIEENFNISEPEEVEVVKEYKR